METRLVIQSTPNPNALKFVLNRPVKTAGNITYKSAAECGENPLAGALFALDENITEVYFFDNYVTVTQNGQAEWDALEENIRKAILEKIDEHNPDFSVPRTEKKSAPAVNSPEIDRINSILDETVRPALQMDGGDLEVLSYEDNVLWISYQGACGSCPSATMGTLYAIENLLKDRFNPEISVQLGNEY